jgi:phosphopentomutase
LTYLRKKRGEPAFIFTNLVDFDMLFGHRRDAQGYAGSLVELDSFLPKIFSELTEEDLLILTADHGCDPTFRGTDHTREFVPLIAYRPGYAGANLGQTTTFTDIAATVLDAFGVPRTVCSEALPDLGAGFLPKLSSEGR